MKNPEKKACPNGKSFGPPEVAHQIQIVMTMNKGGEKIWD
jgi:CxxC motif-containing protein